MHKAGKGYNSISKDLYVHQSTKKCLQMEKIQDFCYSPCNKQARKRGKWSKNKSKNTCRKCVTFSFFTCSQKETSTKKGVNGKTLRRKSLLSKKHCRMFQVCQRLLGCSSTSGTLFFGQMRQNWTFWGGGESRVLYLVTKKARHTKTKVLVQEWSIVEGVLWFQMPSLHWGKLYPKFYQGILQENVKTWAEAECLGDATTEEHYAVAFPLKCCGMTWAGLCVYSLTLWNTQIWFSLKHQQQQLHGARGRVHPAVWGWEILFWNLKTNCGCSFFADWWISAPLYIWETLNCLSLTLLTC